MNYLAHLYLSGEDNKLLTGNFIGDYVKGKNYLKYPGKIREGILLHRRIDTFTDQHPRFRDVKKLLREEFGLFSGIITDLFYDHFLARNWDNYSTYTLRSYANKAHSVLLSHFFYLPARVQGFLPVLIKNRRLESYARQEGIRQSLKLMGRYTSLPENATQAMDTLEMNFGFLQENFTAFMLDMIDYVEKDFGVEIKKPGYVVTP
ncbi:MAG: ACP phosphodiesterase [Bacteroidota bacterium]